MNDLLPDSSERPVLLFDGVCNLCNGFVQAIIRNDSKKLFRFSSLQSGTGARVLQYVSQDMGAVPDSLILVYRDKYYLRSDAALKTAQLLGGKWLFLTIGYIFPKFLRNKIYDLVARNRYKWFGRRDECMVPTRELNERFLD
ncbi:MAG: thiol-disulfide oxidoreductase DCC family protein [Chitinophagales bacterium]|nr:thiol-disulfide oxidoreductase DCC family protein [Chitinophagales bacterium]